MTATPHVRRDPFWITAVAIVVMLIAARLIRVFTGFGYNVVTEPFDPLLLLGDVVLHLVIFFAVLIPLRAVWRRTVESPA